MVHLNIAVALLGLSFGSTFGVAAPANLTERNEIVKRAGGKVSPLAPYSAPPRNDSGELRWRAGAQLTVDGHLLANAGTVRLPHSPVLRRRIKVIVVVRLEQELRAAGVRA